MRYQRLFQEEALKITDIPNFCLWVDTKLVEGNHINYTLYNPDVFLKDKEAMRIIKTNIKKNDKAAFEEVFKMYFFESIYGMIQIGHEPKIVPELAYKIDFSAAKPGSKAGVLLYDIAMSWASKKEKGLVPDRDSVSPFAQKVWNYYFTKRNDVKHIPLDDFKKPVTKNKKDDGKLYTKKNIPKEFADKGYDHRSFINQIYMMKKPLNYSNLMKNHNSFLMNLYTELKKGIDEKTLKINIMESIRLGMAIGQAEFFNSIYDYDNN